MPGRSFRLEGVVQGVGMRPFLARLALRFGLAGEVRNDLGGVRGSVFGPETALERFAEALAEPPPLARIERCSWSTDDGPEPTEFRILASDDGPPGGSVPPPDAALCAACRRELLDPDNRRYRHPFINCTDCGPRFSILLRLPYDRANTTMRAFPPCAACEAEYADPADRRFHAETNCCPACGPRLALHDGAGEPLGGDPLAGAVARLREGRILAVQGWGGFHLACDARDETAVRRLRERKGRESKPFAVMVRDAALAAALVDLPPTASDLWASPACPILIAPARRTPTAPPVAPAVASGPDLGLLLPYTPLHVLLLEDGPDALVMTSGNLSDEPLAAAPSEAFSRLRGIADAFLIHDREIRNRQDDGVVFAASRPLLARRARGEAPAGLPVGMPVEGVLGFGAILKCTAAVGRGETIHLTQHIGDLDSLPALEFHREAAARLLDLLGVTPRLAACDLHPEAPSTRLARESGLPVEPVQHHHAHLAAVLAETGGDRRCLGFAFDGSGYGEDGTVWGGEVFDFTAVSARRVFHLDPLPMPGGDRAAREPWRMALSLLASHGLPWRRFVTHPQAETIAALLASGAPMPRTSALGRLFDAVASLCGLCHENRHEAEAAAALEAVAGPAGDPYPFAFAGSRIRLDGIATGIAEDLGQGRSAASIATRFHSTLVEIMAAAALRLREETGISEVCCAGGCFLNRRLLAGAEARLGALGFLVRVPRRLPPGDGAVACGQVLVAAARRRTSAR